MQDAKLKRKLLVMPITVCQDYLARARLDGRGFVILGAGGGGLGDATCIALAGAGAELICVDWLPDQADAIATRVGGTKYVADVTKRDEMNTLFSEAASRFGDRFSGVVDIVGIARNSRIVDLDDEAIDHQFSIVLRHALLTIQIAGPLLAAAGGGSLTFIGSLAGIAAIPGMTAYGLAKAALHQLVVCAANELGADGVRVNAVVPGVTSTPRLLALLPEEAWRQLASSNPSKRVATPEDIAKAVLFLVSDLAEYVTGNIMMLDGGVSHTLQAPGLEASGSARR